MRGRRCGMHRGVAMQGGGLRGKPDPGYRGLQVSRDSRG